MKKLFLALALSLVVGVASAQCQIFRADGIVEPCAPKAAPAPNPQQASANPCQLGGMLAYRAYLSATPDALYPSANRLHYAVDYFGDMLTLKHDRAMAHRAVEFIAIKLQGTGMRKPWDGAVYEATREFIIKECGVN